MNSFLEKNYIASECSVTGWEFNSAIEIEKKYKNKIEINELKIVTESEEFTLQSHNDMEKAVEAWCRQFQDKNISYKSIFVIYGFGDVRYLKKIITKYPENLFFVYEPFEYVIVNQMYKYDISNLLEKENLYIFTGKNRKQELRTYMGSIITYDNYHYLNYGVIPNYIKADIKEYYAFKETIDYFICNEVESARLMITSEKERGRNFLFNLNDFLYQAGIKQLKESFMKYKIDDYPAVIVSAGPSLDKNIGELSKYRHKAFIVGVNASLKVLIRHNITPDIMLSHDSAISDFTPFYDDNINKIPLLTSITADYRVVQKNRARRFFGYENNPYINEIAKKVNVKLIEIDTGACVANAAFAFVQAMGFKTIILMGQDLAYTNNKVHAGHRDDENEINTDEKDYIMVNGVCEKEVPTDAIMCVYRRWFEDRIKDYQDLNVINATEGGAFIEGATHMKLKEALSKYCVGKELDFRKIIDESEYAFTEGERNKANSIIRMTEENIDNSKKKILESKKIYEQIDELNRKQKYGTSKFKKYVEEAGKFERKIEQNMDMELIKLFVNKAEISVKNKMRKKEGSTYEEIKLVTDLGMELLDGYALACDKLKETWEEVHTLIEESENERANEKTI